MNYGIAVKTVFHFLKEIENSIFSNKSRYFQGVLTEK